MKILLLGKNGQVGRELQRTLLPLGELMSLGRDEADLANLLTLKNILCTHTPDIIVNAAAYTAVDKAEHDIENAYKINAEAVEILATYAQQSKALLVHYSTDYVFDGEKPGIYSEADSTNPQNVYGKSKRAGEQLIQRSLCNALIFRTSWVYSSHGNNFIKTILRLAKEREHLSIVSDQYGAPTSAELLADVTSLAIANYKNRVMANGIYHLTARGKTNWYELASYIVESALKNGIPLQAKKIHPITAQEYPLPAKRPKNSCLDTSLLSTTLNIQLPDWKMHVNRVIDQLTQ